MLAIGKTKRPLLVEGIAFYAKRLPGLEVVELKDSTHAKEAAAVRNAGKPVERLVWCSSQKKGESWIHWASQRCWGIGLLSGWQW